MFNNSSEPPINPPQGIIDLKEKSVPICQITEPYSRPLAVLRGVIDVSKLKEKLLDPTSKIWDQDYQSISNVKLIRPAHDNWGIGKIIFHFCDDFLQKIVDLPWSRDDEWRALLSPIYNKCGIKESQVIRALFASMPPGAVIPVHHDTGYWVRNSHRVHVAIDTGDQVDFMVGCNNDSLRKVIFAEGHIVELNNQAKHAVESRLDRPRIHFIFDYIEEDMVDKIPRYSLSPGSVIHQTRRSIDLPLHRGTKPSPSFIILGAQKSGTTSLYELICQHSLAIKGKRRESHYFDWNWNTTISNTDSKSYYEKHLKIYQSFYNTEMLDTHPSLFTGESTPSYFLHSDLVIPRIKAMLPWVKLFIILRNPVDRAFSQYQMCIDMSGTDLQRQTRGLSHYIGKGFKDVVLEEIAELHSMGISPTCSAEVFQSKFLSTRPMGHGGHSIIGRGLYHLQIMPWLKEFSLNERLMVLDIEDIKGSEAQVQSTMDRVFRFIGEPCDEIHDVAAKNTRAYDKLDEETRKLLSDFYKPYNQQLFELLGRTFNW